VRPSEHVNTLVDFCARRDVDALTRDAVEEAAGGRVDVAILFGGSILAGGDLFATAITGGIAARFLIVGGQGHSTDALYDAVREHLGWEDVAGQPEAALFQRYLRERHGVEADLLETESTNCGTNVEYALALLAAERIAHQRLVLVQDASMQLRMDACFRLHAPDARLVNFAAHRTRVSESGYVSPPLGMWARDRYVSLLLGKIPRLSPTGYGPAGHGFIAHVDIPDAVRAAHSALEAAGVGSTRVADPRWASRAV
jgi:uncharacterized SAM-binding protein YcdF (DUF218 family)